MKNVLATIVAALLALSGCSSPDSALLVYIDHHSLKLAPVTDEFEMAIAQTNSILAAKSSSIRLRSASEQTQQKSENDVVPVAWVMSSSSSSLPMAHVPESFSAIVINSREVGGFLFRYASDRKPRYWGDRPLKVGEPTDLLTFILLHEAGHISHGHAGSFDAHRIETNTQINPIKEMELAADEFVADCVRAALDSADPEASSAAYRIQLLTRRFATQQAIERYSRHPPSRYVSPFTRAGNPNATPSGDRRIVYGDPARTHPNLELRMMVVWYRIEKTPDSARALRRYLEARGDRVLPRLLKLPEILDDGKPTQGDDS